MTNHLIIGLAVLLQLLFAAAETDFWPALQPFRASPFVGWFVPIVLIVFRRRIREHQRAVWTLLAVGMLVGMLGRVAEAPLMSIGGWIGGASAAAAIGARDFSEIAGEESRPVVPVLAAVLLGFAAAWLVAGSLGW